MWEDKQPRTDVECAAQQEGSFMRGVPLRRSWRPWLQSTQIVVTIALCILLLRQMAWADPLPLVAQLRWDFVALSISVVLIIHLLNVARWQYILQQRTVGYGRLLAIYGAGLFSNNFLPTGIGGDGLRIALLSRQVPLSLATLSVALDRGIGLVALSALFGIGIWYGMPPEIAARVHTVLGAVEQRGLLLWLLVSLMASVVLAYLCWRYIPRLWDGVSCLAARFRPRELEKYWTQGHLRTILIGGYAYSAVAHLLLVVTYWLVFKSLNVDLSASAAIWLTLSASISLLAPITINGLGLQESVFVIILGYYGVGMTQALGGALLVRLFMLFYSLIGALLFLPWPRTHLSKRRYGL